MWFTEPDGELLYAVLETPTEGPFSDDAVVLWPEAWADRPLGAFLQHFEKQADKKAANSGAFGRWGGRSRWKDQFTNGYRQVTLENGRKQMIPEESDIPDLLKKADRLQKIISELEGKRAGLIELAEMGISGPLETFDREMEKRRDALEEILVWLEVLGFSRESKPQPTYAGIYEGEVRGILTIQDETIVTYGHLKRLLGTGEPVVLATGTNMGRAKVSGGKTV